MKYIVNTPTFPFIAGQGAMPSACSMVIDGQKFSFDFGSEIYSDSGLDDLEVIEHEGNVYVSEYLIEQLLSNEVITHG